jgi:hypothetical protein
MLVVASRLNEEDLASCAVLASRGRGQREDRKKTLAKFRANCRALPPSSLRSFGQITPFPILKRVPEPLSMATLEFHHGKAQASLNRGAHSHSLLWPGFAVYNRKRNLNDYEVTDHEALMTVMADGGR